MKLAEMRQMLSDRGIQLTKSLGQNFLHEEKVVAKIAAAGELTKADKVLEIGPGLGPLTELLLAQAGEVLAIEMDMRLVALLRGRFQGQPLTPSLSPSDGERVADRPGEGKSGVAALQLIHADALKYLETHPRDWRGWKLVANMPYSVASPLLVELALNEHGPDRMVVTLQREVAERLRAKANEEDYGLLTLLVQLNYEPRALFKISAGCFFPQPNVDSACLTLMRRAKPLLTPEQTPVFVRIVKQAFSQRRKMMAKLLRADWPEDKLAAAMSGLGLSPQIRAEAVTLEQFVRLTQSLCA
jgi:16S rRNA (adenine1518-N6/adenine1519-N6)-dimethyltransferase